MENADGDRQDCQLTGLGMEMPAVVIALTPVHPELQSTIDDLSCFPKTAWHSCDLAALADKDPDLVLLAPPDPKDSAAIARLLRDHWKNQLIPTVVLLPAGREDVLVEAYATGVDHVWTPDAPVAALRARVGSLLRVRSIVALLVESRNRAKGRIEDYQRWARFLVHDMRNPLTTISAGLDGLRGCESLTEEDRSFCVEMSHELRRLSSMVSDLLDHERLANGNLRARSEPTDLAEMLERIVTGCQAIARLRRVRIRLTSGGGDPVLQVDAKLLERVVENVMANAVRYSPENEDVDVHLTASSSSATIIVLNSGPPIPPEHREKIFEPFVQLEGRSRHGGAGLGLAFCREVMNAHCGTIRATERDGRVCFMLHLPRG